MKGIKTNTTLSPFKLYSYLFITFIIGAISIFLPVNFFIDMLLKISTRQDQITLDKGVYYLFGGGVFFLLVVLVYFNTKVFKVSEKIEKFVVTLMIISIILIFALPQIVHITVENYLEDEGYQICQEQSHRWLYVVTIVYTKTLPCGDN